MNIRIRASLVLVLAALVPACGGSGGGGGAPPPGAFALLSPDDGANGVHVLTAFSWEASADAATYTFELADNPTFTPAVLVQAGITATTYALASALDGYSGYYWRVTAVNAAGTTVSTGLFWTFSTGLALPAPFALLSPADAALNVPVAPLFAWSPSAEAASYVFELSTAADFSALLVQQAGLTQLSFVAANELAPGTAFHWRVTAVNASGQITAAPRSFTTAALPSPSWAGVLTAVPEGFPQYFGMVSLADGAFTRVSGTSLIGFAAIEGLAADPLTGELYASDVSSGDLVRFDPQTGVATALGFTGYDEILSLAFDPDSGTLYGADNETWTLLSLDTTTGKGTPVASLSVGFVQGMAYDRDADLLYGSSGGNLITINPATGVGTVVGSFGVPTVASLGYDDETDTLYGGETFYDDLVTVNRSTGAATVVGGASELKGLDYDTGADALYGWAVREIQTLDPATGAVLKRQSTGFYAIEGLAFDAATNRLYAIRNYPPELVRVDPQTGVGRTVGPLNLPGNSPKVESLAWKPSTSTLYAVDTWNGTLLTINPATGASAVVGTPGIMAPSRVKGLEYDPSTDTLYGADEYAQRLVSVSMSTGALTPIGPLGAGSLESLAMDPATGILYAGSRVNNSLYRIDKATGRAYRLGPPHVPLTGLAWDSLTGRLMGTSSGSGWVSDALMKVDPLSGRPTTVGAFGFNPVHALAYDPATGTIYGVWTKYSSEEHLLRIDATTGEATMISRVAGPGGVGEIEALAYDPSTRTLYATDGYYDNLLTIRTTTGASAVVGNLGYDVKALAIHPATGTLYGVRQGVAPNRLITINKATGQGSEVGGSAGLEGVQGLAFHPTTHVLYGTNAARELVEINPATGASTVLGTSPRVLLDLLFR